MDGYWIKMRHALTSDPKVLQIAAATGLDEFGVIGRLHAVWSWLDQQSEDGMGVRITAAFLDRLTACPKFAAGMRTAGWITGRDGALDFPGYAEHNGETAKQRAIDCKRKARARVNKRKELQAGAAKDDPAAEEGVPEHPGTEERRRENNESVCGARVSLAEALELAATRPGFKADVVRHWHAQRHGQGWVRANGQAITNWQSDLEVWVMRNARGDTPSGPGGTNTKARPEATAAAAGQYDEAWG